MASIRRTVSPSLRLPLSTSSKYHRYFPSSTSAPCSVCPWQHIHILHILWRPLPRFVLFFLLGFMVGLFPFAHLHFDLDIDLRSVPFPPPSLWPRPQSHPQQQVDLDSVVSVQLRQHNSQQDHNNNNNQAIIEDHTDTDTDIDSNSKGKLVIVVTPTDNRAAQGYHLNRLAHTLRLADPPLLWIVVEMGDDVTAETANILRNSGLMYRHLVCPKQNSANFKDRGVHQRNAALDHIEKHRLDGIVYFADADNVYSLDLFHQIRHIRKFGTWPIAMLARGKNKAILEGPVCEGKRVIGWHTNEKSKRLRRFHVDMSGFAFNSTLLWDPKRRYHVSWNAIRQLDSVNEGFQETTFIEQLVEDESEMEAVPPGCNKIMNWHLNFEAKKVAYPKGWQLSRNLDAVTLATLKH